jgi:ATP-dependent DNA ligase
MLQINSGAEAMSVLQPPIPLVLARDTAKVPGPDARWVYEPKFDGWRAAVFTASGVVQSRRDNNLAARFPEIATAARKLGDLVLDGELVALHNGKLDFGALTSAPASRRTTGITIYYIAFDLLAEDNSDLRTEPYRHRRSRLEHHFAGVPPPLQLIPTTTDRVTALQWMQADVASIGIEGLVAKGRDSLYRAGRTGDWQKVRQTTVVDAAAIGVTGPLDRPDALLLARPDPDGALQPIGLSLPLSPAQQQAAAEQIESTGEPRRQLLGILGHSGSDYQPIHPTLVVEAETEPTVTTFNNRLRPRVHRLRTDLTVEDIE